jgi:hypothetical protein
MPVQWQEEDVMNIGDPVFVINSADAYFGHRFIIRGVAQDFQGRITGYTVNGDGGHWRDYAITDIQYAISGQKSATRQMQLL